MKATAVTIAGAGPTGALLAIFLRRRGFEVTIYERRADPSGNAPGGDATHAPASGAGNAGARSINLALAARGIHALRKAGVYDVIRSELMPMRGRMIHDGGAVNFQPYGQNADESIYSISRERLNRVLVELARREFGATIHFGHKLIDVDPVQRTIAVEDVSGERGSRLGGRGIGASATALDTRGSIRSIALGDGALIGADGAGSQVRHALEGRGFLRATEEPLDHGYKELSVPAGPQGFVMAKDALHIWPRSDYMLIALPNNDGTFAATLFLPRAGDPSFASLQDRRAIEEFFRHDFPDALGCMPAAIEEFQAHPTGFLGTLHANRWHTGGVALLIGDAAHAIVPFHGQGLNCGFEDCVQLDALLDRHSRWEDLFAEFERLRKPESEAIAAMALENYVEMRDSVADARFRLEKALSLELERRFPERFVPRYSMVSFHHEIPYSVARARGAIQQAILNRLTDSVERLEQVDFAAAARAIEAELPPIRSVQGIRVKPASRQA